MVRMVVVTMTMMMMMMVMNGNFSSSSFSLGPTKQKAVFLQKRKRSFSSKSLLISKPNSNFVSTELEIEYKTLSKSIEVKQNTKMKSCQFSNKKILKTTESLETNSTLVYNKMPSPSYNKTSQMTNHFMFCRLVIFLRYGS